MIDVDVLEIVEALQHVVRRVVEHACTFVASGALMEHLVAHSVVQILARMNLVADVDTAIGGMLENRPPALGELVECRLDEAGQG